MGVFLLVVCPDPSGVRPWLLLGDLDKCLAGIDLLADHADDFRIGRFDRNGAGHIDLKSGVLDDVLGGRGGIVAGEVHSLGLLVELHNAAVGNDHLGSAVGGQALLGTAVGTVDIAGAGDVVDLVHEAALLVLHHDDGVGEGGDAVGAAGAR